MPWSTGGPTEWPTGWSFGWPTLRPSRSSGRSRLAGDRRGVSLVMIAVSLVAVLGLAGVGVDFARAYTARSRLKTKADAAALAGAVELLAGRTANAAPRALALRYDSLNRVDGVLAALPADDVQAVAYDFNTGAVTRYGANFANAAVNAVEVVARYNVPTMFSGVLGRTQLGLRERTVAALGGVGVQNCLRPWVVSYQTLLTQLDQLNPSGAPRTAPGYNLTNADVQLLSSNSAPLTLLSGGNNTTASGNIGQVAVWDSTYSNSSSSNNVYQQAIIGNIPCSQTIPVGPGTVLQANPGNGTTGTGTALQTFCSNNGGVTSLGGNGNNNRGFTCNTTPLLRLALWSSVTGTGATAQYTVKYVGAFKTVGFQPGTNGNQSGACGAANTVDQVCGIFTSMAVDGAFTGSPGLTRKAALVY